MQRTGPHSILPPPGMPWPLQPLLRDLHFWETATLTSFTSLCLLKSTYDWQSVYQQENQESFLSLQS